MRKIGILIFILLLASASVARETKSDCIASKYRMYAQSQESLQRELTQLIIQVAPSYSDVAQLYMNDQLHAIERALLAVGYLNDRSPAKLRTNMALNNWLSLDKRDRKLIASQSKRYAELLRLWEAAKNRPPHPDGDGLRQLMRTEIIKKTEYGKLMEVFSDSVKDIESIKCGK